MKIFFHENYQITLVPESGFEEAYLFGMSKGKTDKSEYKQYYVSMDTGMSSDSLMQVHISPSKFPSRLVTNDSKPDYQNINVDKPQK